MTAQPFPFTPFDVSTDNNNTKSLFTQEQQNFIYTLVQKGITRDLLNFKESLSRSNNISEAKTDNKIIAVEASMKVINDKLSEISSLANVLTIKLKKIDEMTLSLNRIKDQMISQEIRLNSTTKEFNEACYKYDKMFLDNLVVPKSIVILIIQIKTQIGFIVRL